MAVHIRRPEWLPLAMRAAGLALVVLLLGSCEEPGSGDRPTTTPSRLQSALPSSTATLPSATRSLGRDETRSPSATAQPEPSPTRSPARPDTPSPTPTATQPSPTQSPAPPDAPSTTPTGPEPSPTRSRVRDETASPTTTAPEPSPTQSETSPETASPSPAPAPSPTTSPAVQPTSAESSGAPSWLWWVLAATALAVAVAVPLLVRARRRRAWRADLASAEEEVAWFARGLIPELRQMASLAEVAGGWNVAASRVVAAEDRLTALETSAPDDAARTRTRALRDALRTARVHMQQLLESGSPDTISRDLDAVAAELEAVLGSANAPE